MTAREAALDWIRRALAYELRDDSPMIGTRAENLNAIAEHYEIPTEAVIKWIHTPVLGKQWTAAEFRRFAELVAEEQRSEQRSEAKL